MPIEIRLQVGDSPPREYHFDRGDIVLGCHPFNDLVVSGVGLSARHGRLKVVEGSLHYEHLNGTDSARLKRDGASDVDSTRFESLEVGDVLLLGQDHRVRLEVIAWMSTSGPTVERVPTQELSPAEEFAAFDEDLQVALLNGYARVLSSGTLAGLSAFVDELSRFVIEDNADVRASIVLPQGERGFHDLVVVCSGDDYRAEFLTPDSARILRELAEGDSVIILHNPDGSVDVNVPFVSPEACDPLLAYLRVSMNIPPTTEAIPVFAALANAIRPIVLTLLRMDALGNELAQLEAENRYFRTRSRRHYLFKELVTRSESMQRLHTRLRAIVESDTPALVVGPAGAGKKMVGRALHHLGSRHEGMFIAQNCGELTLEELDTELFGVAGERQGDQEPCKGLFELADGGTLFIDEVDRLPMHLQTKLMRVLREREVRRVGDQVGRPVDVRVVAGTHRDLEAMVRRGEFRRDLFALMARSQLQVPPLTERVEDIIPLAEHFVVKYARRYGKPVLGLTASACELLQSHTWPGNVRELQVVIETAVLAAEEGPVDDEHLQLVGSEKAM